MDIVVFIIIGILIAWIILYISILFLGYYWGSIKYFAERTYHKKRKVYGNPEDHF